MPTVSFQCESCKNFSAAEISKTPKIFCSFCSKTWDIVDPAAFFQSCPICACRQFYIQKDFNRALGCFLMLIGIVLVPVTYGISLIVLSFVDWMLYRRVQTMVVCYKCGTEFRGFEVPANLKTFRHPIGVKYQNE